jgi:hypothetical protein
MNGSCHFKRLMVYLRGLHSEGYLIESSVDYIESDAHVGQTPIHMSAQCCESGEHSVRGSLRFFETEMKDTRDIFLQYLIY